MRGFTSRVGQIGVFVFLPIGMFCVGVVTWAAGKLVDAKESFHTALVVAAYAFAPRVLEGVINGLQALFLDPAQFNGRFRITFGPGRFLDPDTARRLLIAVVGRLDLFTLWITVARRHRSVRDRPHSAPPRRDRRRRRVARRRPSDHPAGHPHDVMWRAEGE